MRKFNQDPLSPEENGRVREMLFERQWRAEFRRKAKELITSLRWLWANAPFVLAAAIILLGEERVRWVLELFGWSSN